MKTIRIFISSPGDVTEERDRARQVVDQLQRRYAVRLKLVPVLWEELPLQADMSFQQGIDLVLSEKQGIDIAVFILWSRLGSPLGALTRKPDGSAYRSGTEREFDLMLEARQQSGGERPAILAYVRQDDASFKKVLSDKAVGDLDSLLQQHKLVQQFIREQFHDPQSGTNMRAYHTFNDPVSFATRLREHLRQQLDGLLPENARPEARWDRPPFQGLEVFDVEHADIFFGREQAVCDMQMALREQAAKGCAFVLILGASGSGKSSLARAGVLAAFIRDNLDPAVSTWRWGVLLPGRHANNLGLGLAQTLASPSGLPELREDENSIPELGVALVKAPELAFNLRVKSAFKKAGEGRPGEVRLLLLVDQLEELFTHPAVSAEDITAFLQALEALARSGSVWLLVTVRSDFYACCQRFPVLMTLKEGHGQYDLLPPRPAELHRIISEPVWLAGLRYEHKEDAGESLDQRILNDAAKNPEALPLLEYLLRELYEHRSAEGLLTWQAYEELGGVEGALGRRAEAVFLRLPVEAQEALGEVLHALLTVSEQDENAIMRRRARLANLTDTPAKRALVEALLRARLLVADKDEAGQPVAEVAHEALLRRWERASQWAKDHREFLRSRERLAQACARWRAEAQDSDFLLPAGKPLVEAEELLRTRSKWLSTELVEYVLRCSAANKDRERRGLEGLRVVALMSLVLVVLVCSPLLAVISHAASADRRRAVVAWQERSQRITQLARREEEELLGEARQLLLAVSESRAVRSASPEACKKSLKEVFASYPSYVNLGLIDTNGAVLASALSFAEPANEADLAFVRRVIKTRAFAADGFMTRLPQSKPTVAFGCPVVDASGSVQAVVVAWMGSDWLTKTTPEFSTQVPRGATWTLIKRDGTVLARYPASGPPSGQPFPDRTLIKAMFSQPEGIAEAPDSKGVPVFHALALMDSQLAGGKVASVLGIPKQILFAAGNRALIRNLFWLGLAAGLSLVLGWFGSKLLILRRVETLVSPRGVKLRPEKDTRSRGRKTPNKD